MGHIIPSSRVYHSQHPRLRLPCIVLDYIDSEEIMVAAWADPLEKVSLDLKSRAWMCACRCLGLGSMICHHPIQFYHIKGEVGSLLVYDYYATVTQWGQYPKYRP